MAFKVSYLNLDSYLVLTDALFIVLDLKVKALHHLHKLKQLASDTITRYLKKSWRNLQSSLHDASVEGIHPG